MTSTYLRPAAAGALLLSALGQSPAHAVTAPITYVGGGFITAVTSSCATAGFAANQGYTVVYRPAGSGFNDGLVLQFQAGGVLVSGKTASLNGRKTFTSSGFSDKAIPYSGSGTSTLTITTAADNLSVTIIGKIPNLYGDPSCTVSIRAAATQRP